MRIATTLIIVLLLIPIGAIMLQIFLSRREGKIPGLILPLTTFLCSLVYPLNMAAPSGGMTIGFLLQMALVWLIVNIPTVILLVIYFSCREKRSRSRQLDKMTVQDLD